MSRFPRREYERVLRAIESLAEDPKPSGARKMTGRGTSEIGASGSAGTTESSTA
jgi:hypothetical protein